MHVIAVHIMHIRILKVLVCGPFFWILIDQFVVLLIKITKITLSFPKSQSLSPKYFFNYFCMKQILRKKFGISGLGIRHILINQFFFFKENDQL